MSRNNTRSYKKMKDKEFKKLITAIANSITTNNGNKKYITRFQEWFEYGDFSILITYSQRHFCYRMRVSAIYFDGKTFKPTTGNYVAVGTFKFELFTKLPYLIKKACKEFS